MVLDRARGTATTTGVVARLDAEWERLATDPAGAPACERWARGRPALTGTASLADVLARVAAAPDEVLGGLLADAATGDTLAGRVVLQAMLGKVVRMSLVDRCAGVDEYVGALWCVVATYPLESRPARIAANLALDTLKTVHRERRPRGDDAVDPEVVVEVAEARPAALVAVAADGPGRPELTARGVIRRAVAERLLDETTGAVLHSVYAEGLPGRCAARRHGTSPGALRVRCSRALQLLSRHADVLAGAV